MAACACTVYMGTAAFAVPPLRALWEDGYPVVAVVTQPDRPAGRTQALRPSPVKEFALQHGLPLWQPARLRDAEALEHLRSLSPELIVVAAYGEILRPAVLALPQYGCLNLHASLLPRHRGAAPIAAAILAGDRQTGVTLMQMDEGMDTGPVLAQEAVALSGRERQGELAGRLAKVAAGLLRRTLPAWLAGEVAPQPQDETQATTSRILHREDGEIDWARPAQEIERMVRAYDPWPGAYTFLRGHRLHIRQARVLPGESLFSAGTILPESGRLIVATGEGLLILEEVQLEGKRPLPTDEFLRGQRELAGGKLG